MAGFFFAKVNDTDTTFSAAFQREDYKVLSFDIGHTEGNHPTLEIEVPNPRVGLLGQPTWGWLTYDNGVEIIPLFFGRLQGIPNELDKEVLKLNYLARSSRWLLLKQAAVEALKVKPGWDPVFLDPTRRDDPDSIMEGYSAAIHYDRIPSGSPADLAITVSDILVPEDGILVLTADQILYDNFNFSLGQQPLVVEQIKSSVRWNQRAAGTVDMGNKTFAGIWTGGSLIESWPKGGQQLAGGYVVASATAFNGGAQYGSPISRQFHYENTANKHNNGDVMSINTSWTQWPCGGIIYIYDTTSQAGLVMPSIQFASFNQNDDGSTTEYASTDGLQGDGINIPAHVAFSQLLVCLWDVFTTLQLDYEANRPRTEHIEFLLNADVQQILTDPFQPASVDAETTTIDGSDVGIPIQLVLSWYTVFLRGKVELGQVVQSTVEFVGGPLYAICVGFTNGSGNVLDGNPSGTGTIGVAGPGQPAGPTLPSGIPGVTEPNWSDILGTIIEDGEVLWAMIGANVPQDFDYWKDVANSEVTAGTIIRAATYLSPPRTQTGIVASPAPIAGVSSFQLAIRTGTTQQYSNALFTGVADTHPDHPEPDFSTVPGVLTQDNSVTWVSLGDGGDVMELPLGLNTAARTFFPKDRGILALQHLVGIARAKLLFRARVAKCTFETPFENALGLSLRMGCEIFDKRLPGGRMIGKITEYHLKMSGDGIAPIAQITIEGSIGNTGISIDTHHGVGVDHHHGVTSGLEETPTYAVDYDDGSYQVYDESTITGSGGTDGSLPPTVVTASFSNGDVGFTPPADAPNDDGVDFPATKGELVVKEVVVTGKPPGAPDFLPNNVYTLQNTFTLPNGIIEEVTEIINIPNGYTPVQVPVTIPGNILVPTQTVNELVFFPITQYYLELLSLERSFSDEFVIETTVLGVPQMIDLSAPSLS